MKTFTSCLGWIAIMFGLQFIYPAVTVALWRWYIVPTFHVAPLRWIVAFGIGLIFSYLSPKPSSKSAEKGATDPATAVATAFAMPLGVLLFGWIGHFFI